MKYKIDYYKKIWNEKSKDLKAKSCKNKIIDSFWLLKFYESTHTYKVLLGEKEKEVQSVSHFIHTFKEQQDWDFIAERYANKVNKTKEEIQNLWKWNNIMATNSGSNVHLFGESCFYFFQGDKEGVIKRNPLQFEQGWLFPNCSREQAVFNFWLNELAENENLLPLLSEQKVLEKNLNFAGTFDLLIWDKKEGGVWIYDYKTNKDLFDNFGEKVLLSPFDDMLDMNFSIYTLQLSAYQIPLEDLGIKVLGRRLIWVKENSEYKVLDVEDKSKDLRKYLSI